MRTTTVLALLGAATCALANAEPEQIHHPVAVIARHVEAECEVDATADVEGQATPAPAVISDVGHDSKPSWSEINTTVTVDARPWAGNTTSKHYRPLVLRPQTDLATDTPATPLPTDEADTTDSDPAEVTGGALPQPMKASAAGLLGFFIMSLVML
jgi:hypothetical protein